MGRKKFIIDNELKSKIAWQWIVNQKLNNSDFDDIADYQFLELNSWSEKNLNKKQWTKLKITIRARKLKKKITISIDTKSHLILKELSKSYKVTLSELIIMKLENEWISLPDEILAEENKPISEPEQPSQEEETVKLPVTMAEYEQLVDKLKQSPEWQTKNPHGQNMARIYKMAGVSLPDGSMSKPKLMVYLKTLPQ